MSDTETSKFDATKKFIEPLKDVEAQKFIVDVNAPRKFFTAVNTQLRRRGSSPLIVNEKKIYKGLYPEGKYQCWHTEWVTQTTDSNKKNLCAVHKNIMELFCETCVKDLNYNAHALDVFRQCKQWRPNVLADKGGQGRGGASNKFAFQTAFAEKINSPLQTHLIALFFCPDTYNDVKKMAHRKIPENQSFYDQLDCLNSSTLTVHVVGNRVTNATLHDKHGKRLASSGEANGKAESISKQLSFIFISDFAFLNVTAGIMGCSSAHGCFACTDSCQHHKFDSSDGRPRTDALLKSDLEKFTSYCKQRCLSIDSAKKIAKSLSNNVIYEKLLPFSIEQYATPILHIFLGLINRIQANITSICEYFDAHLSSELQDFYLDMLKEKKILFCAYFGGTLNTGVNDVDASSYLPTILKLPAIFFSADFLFFNPYIEPKSK